jgi:hypothetical protein
LRGCWPEKLGVKPGSDSASAIRHTASSSKDAKEGDDGNSLGKIIASSSIDVDVDTDFINADPHATTDFGTSTNTDTDVKH